MATFLTFAVVSFFRMSIKQEDNPLLTTSASIWVEWRTNWPRIEHSRIF